MADTKPAHSFQVKDEKQMKATHPASQENVDYLTCPAYVIQSLATQQNLTWIVLCTCHARDGGNGGGWPALGHCTKRKAPLQEAGTGEEEPSMALPPSKVFRPCIATCCRHLWLLHMPWGASPRNAETGWWCAVERRPFHSSRLCGLPGPESWLLEILGWALTSETPLLHLQTTRPHGCGLPSGAWQENHAESTQARASPGLESAQ